MFIFTRIFLSFWSQDCPFLESGRGGLILGKSLVYLFRFRWQRTTSKKVTDSAHQRALLKFHHCPTVGTIRGFWEPKMHFMMCQNEFEKTFYFLSNALPVSRIKLKVNWAIPLVILTRISSNLNHLNRRNLNHIFDHISEIYHFRSSFKL